jgi:cyclic beta-1,2-glucan glucanotransferase
VAHPGAVVEETEASEPLRSLASAPIASAGRRAPRVIDLLVGAREAIERAHRRLRGGGGEGVETPAAEWLLDNYYVVERAFRVVRDEFPGDFERRLPRLATGRLAGYPLGFALAREFVAAGGGHVDADSATRLAARFQALRPLSIAEIWALPILLRAALLEQLGVAARGIAPPAEEAGRAAVLASPPQAATDHVVSSSIRSLRALDVADWKEFFEEVSETEKILRRDPSRTYARMDFETRDRYRKAVEDLAAQSGRAEEEVAEAAVRAARENHDGRATHVGYHLVDAGVTNLARALGAHPPWRTRSRRFLRRHPTGAYLGAIAVLTVLHESALCAALRTFDTGVALAAVAALLAIVPAATIAVTVVNTLVTRLMPPRALPKMDFGTGIPPDCRTVVAMPALLGAAEDVSALLARIELHWLANADANLHLALLTDLGDAPAAVLPGDDALLRRMEEGMRALNARYGEAGPGPFHLLHRPRRWNAAEGCWMGWERKRGKLAEFNCLLAGDGGTDLSARVGSADVLRTMRFVITLDADTELPRDAARRLVATYAHPLNRAEFDEPTSRVVAGYTVLQPRVEVTPLSADASWFAYFFAGDGGLDLYTRAVSDAYQDLFGEGIYVGKGIYDPAAFERSLTGRVPENALLSHDLFEGIHGRTGLVSDVVLLEDYPSDYLTHARRLHRWARGDWQLLPWLGRRVPLEGGRRGPNPLSLVARWKIVDNLRRTLLAPALLGFLLVAWLALPGSPILWTGITLLALAAPALTETAEGLLSTRIFRAPSGTFGGVASRSRRSIALWALHTVLLAHRSVVLSDAIVRTLVRLAVSHRRLLQWTSAAATARALGARTSRRRVWREMMAAPLIAGAAAVVVAFVRPAALPAALPLALLWLASPEIALEANRPRRREIAPLGAEAVHRLRLLARRTWLFFDTFVGPTDQWLPPDHFQETPRGEVAHRTSPTNIGLLQLATLAAYDLGYAGGLAAALRLKNTFDTLARMEGYRGHFYNWYDTRDLEPLPPRYVSTVDSGNLAGALVVVKQGCREIVSAPVAAPQRWDGLLDTVDALAAVVALATQRHGARRFAPLAGCVDRLRRDAIALKTRRSEWGAGVVRLVEHACPDAEGALLAAIAPGVTDLDRELLSELRTWSTEVREHVHAMHRDAELFLPWEIAMASPPAVFTRPEAPGALSAAWASLVAALPRDVALGDLPSACERVAASLARIDEALHTLPRRDIAAIDARAWAGRLAEALPRARAAGQSLLATLDALGRQADDLFRDMDFTWLYDERRHLFHIGYIVAADSADEHHYDLLASEARLASFLAIAKGEVPEEHWLHLGRPFGRLDDGRALLSWSGTMFEYLMPPLLMRESEDSLMGRGCRAAINAQIAYGRRRRVPWGVSEAGYYQFDAQQNYQYRAFGAPDLGLKRGLQDDLVVAPYACVLALPFAPHAALANLRRLEGLGLTGRYGFYEAVDYTRSRLPPGEERAVVRSFMAHHQGMILAALDNVLHDGALRRRFHAEPIVQTAEPLLFERPAETAPIERARPTPDRAPAPLRGRARIAPWPAVRNAAFPQAHVLSNGRYHVMVTETGSASRRKTVSLTRWEADSTLDDHGFRLYLRDLEGGDVWSSTSGGAEVLFHAHMTEIHDRVGTISLTQRVCVAPDDDVEIRHLTLTNESGVRRRLETTSYMEVVLGDAAEYRRHPAFSKLFVESEYLPELHALLFHRRPGGARDSGWLLHMMVPGGRRAEATAYESSREQFLGRRRDARHPAALATGGPRPRGTTGATLDPIMALSAEVDLLPHRRATLAYVVLAADSREDAIALARRYRSPHDLEWAFDLARRSAETEIADVGLTSRDLPLAQKLLSLVLYPHPALRASADVLGRNRLGQSALWRYAISGDLPILLVRVDGTEDAPLLLVVLRAHRLWRRRGVPVDIVVLAEHGGGYEPDVEARIARAITRSGADALRDRPGGVFVLRTAHMPEEERMLLLATARVVLDASATDLAGQLTRLAEEPTRLPPLLPTLPDAALPEPLERPDRLLFDNGLGGFTPDGQGYVVHLGPADATPAPWVNVVANPGFGFVVSESGGGFTWAAHSGENRLTPWRNDPVRDEPGEAMYLRDEETGGVWSPTPLPAPAPGSYQVRHGPGYTAFDHRCRGLDQELIMFVPVDDPVKIVRLRVTNRLDRPRRLTATYYVEWVLGPTRDTTQAFVVSEFDPASQALLAQNAWNEDFTQRVAFAAASEKLHGLTADRTEFLGRHGSRARPAALGRIGLSSTVRPGLDPCAALQVHIDLAPGATADVHFLLGETRSREEAAALVARYRDRANVESARAAVTQQWTSLLGAVQVRTPDPMLDLMLNRWLLYQTLVSRLWARASFYQSGGAFGFRDQLQDATALLHAAPGLCRAHILEAARHQFEAGDVLHWWHPHLGTGVRTRCSDDLLWLPFVTAHYVTATGDETILHEEVDFLKGEPLEPDQASRYDRFASAGQPATLYRHCLAAVERGRTAGPHGLPLFGSGDWNDGMDRVGIGGRGESVWLGWFLSATLTRFAPLCERMGETVRADELRGHAETLRQALETSAWDGAWYRRGYYDDGTPLGSARSAECRIDSLSQSWAVLASAADGRHAAMAIEAARRQLVREEDGLILLLTPPFDHGREHPGYIKAYPPGVRENGGQYTHAAIWFLWALAELGEPDEAVALFHKLSPIHHARTREAAEPYRVEPYVLAADVYGAPPWTGRGGWTWYTGAAGWAYRFGTEVLLGIRLEHGAWRIDPCIPRRWPGFEVTLHDGATSFGIRVTNPHGVTRGVTGTLLDGAPLAQPVVPRLQDGRPHRVELTMG